MILKTVNLHLFVTGCAKTGTYKRKIGAPFDENYCVDVMKAEEHVLLPCVIKNMYRKIINMNDENAEIRYMEKRSGDDQRNQMLSPLGQK